MQPVKITVLKKVWNEDLAKEYARSDLTPCTFHDVGEVFYSSNGWQKPAGLCDNAWKSMQEYVFALAHGAENFYNGQLLSRHQFIASCNDGFRPVSFLLETAENIPVGKQ